MYEVESGFLYNLKRERKGAQKGPERKAFEALEVGQSFFIPISKEHPTPALVRTRINGVMQLARMSWPKPKKFRTNQCEKDGVKGIRVFRIE